MVHIDPASAYIACSVPPLPSFLMGAPERRVLDLKDPSLP
jgi:hypothetical protein